ncbi:NADH-ubiquinone oxidoreductase-F iron-sulfur binding region domain-containing protein [Kineosporia succinea]|uniref:NADH:ubiquinone oxidoreductase subunit F (NADH-binding) n=1 Tax=Kineosporia succinea TaxID=84632 RepID=A0ABT9P2B5_9ACTN|nr:NADH-ubiquinone oxidoreductase-F iron-sulfur binding region domain-containing protein [Kineosporia succinea]MDP9826824.1 NADH:ubiquinone oxidoreductase subunit F (NADH-binding) [Kineosporia succinea]
MTMTAMTPAQGLKMPPEGARLFAAGDPSLTTHYATYGGIPDVTGPQLLEQVRMSGLSGRGGAAFPAATKLQAVAAGGVVIANGAEGEPASRKDAELLRRAPHLVIDGIEVAAHITGAHEAYAYLRADVLPAVRQALAERRTALRITLVEAVDTFVSGQETAVVNRVNNGPALPRFSRHRIFHRGVGDRPTLVQNVETLAQLALIARYGGVWFATAGTPDSTGTFLATVHPVDQPLTTAPTVWEIAHGLSLRHVLEPAAGIPVQQLQAVLIGGYHGTWVPLPAALDAPLSRAGLEPYGAGLGAGVLVPLASTACGLELTASIVGYLARQSAKQCGPCQFGLPELAQNFTALAAGRVGRSGVDAVRQAAGLVENRGVCKHPDGTTRLVRSALRVFADDVTLHQHGRCLARIGDPYGGAR